MSHKHTPNHRGFVTLAKSPPKKNDIDDMSDMIDSDASDNELPFADRVMKKAGICKKSATSNGTKEVAPAPKAAKKGPKKTAVAKRKTAFSDSEDDMFEVKPKKSKTTKKRKVEETDIPPPRQMLGRAKKTTKFKFSDSESDDDFD